MRGDTADEEVAKGERKTANKTTRKKKEEEK